MKMRNLRVRHLEVKWRLNYGTVEQTSRYHSTRSAGRLLSTETSLVDLVSEEALVCDDGGKDYCASFSP